jgi:hypothetical protein
MLAACGDDTAARFDLPSSFGGKLLVMLPTSAVVMTILGLISFKLRKHTASGFLMGVYFVIIAGYALGSTCMNWTAWVDYLLFSIAYLTMVCYWARPKFLQPGGTLQALMYQRIKNTTGPDVDTALYGKPSDYDFTYGQMIYVVLFLIWCTVHVFERYTFYHDLGLEGIHAFAKAIPHAALRFHILCYLSAQQFTVMWAITGMPHERLIAIHKMTGRLFLPLVLAHFVTINKSGDNQYHKPTDAFDWDGVNMIFGMVAMLLLFGVIAVSIPWMRRNKYENFYVSTQPQTQPKPSSISNSPLSPPPLAITLYARSTVEPLQPPIHDVGINVASHEDIRPPFLNLHWINLLL